MSFERGINGTCYGYNAARRRRRVVACFRREILPLILFSTDVEPTLFPLQVSNPGPNCDDPPNGRTTETTGVKSRSNYTRLRVQTR